MQTDEKPVAVEEVLTTARRMLRAAYRRRTSTVTPFAVLLITRNRITHTPLSRPCLSVLRPKDERGLLEQVREKASQLAATAVCLATRADVDGRSMAVIVTETSAGVRLAEAAEILEESLGPLRRVAPHLVKVGRLMETPTGRR